MAQARLKHKWFQGLRASSRLPECDDVGARGILGFQDLLSRAAEDKLPKVLAEALQACGMANPNLLRAYLTMTASELGLVPKQLTLQRKWPSLERCQRITTKRFGGTLVGADDGCFLRVLGQLQGTLVCLIWLFILLGRPHLFCASPSVSCATGCHGSALFQGVTMHVGRDGDSDRALPLAQERDKPFGRRLSGGSGQNV